MIGQSERLSTMIDYHHFGHDMDQAFEDLTSETEGFITHVEVSLPYGREKWWLACAEKNIGTEAAREKLKEDLMVESDPYSKALSCARRMDEARGTGRAERGLEAESSKLQFRSEKVAEKRDRYHEFLAREDRIQRKGSPDWYKIVRAVRKLLKKDLMGPFVQVNQLQAALQKSVPSEAGFPQDAADSLGDTASRRLAVRNQKPGASPQFSGAGRDVLREQPSGAEDAIWALFLSIASGDKVPGGMVLEGGSQLTAPHNGTCILRN